METYNKRLDMLFRVVVILLYTLSDVSCLLVSVSPSTTAILEETSFELICTYTIETDDFVSPYGISWQKKTSTNIYTTIATFSPDGTSQPDPTFTSNVESEYVNRSVLTNPTSTMMQAKLKVNIVKCSDEGRYRCVVQFSNPNGGGSPSAETNVTINSKAQIPYEVPSMHPTLDIEENQEVQFNCTADVGKPKGQILWWKYRSNITAPFSLTSASQTYMDGDCYSNVTSTITITMTKDDDQSVIRCSVNQDLLTGSDSEKPHRNSPRINVYYKVRPPIITRTPELSEYAVGTQVVLKCTASGNPKPGGPNVETSINKYVWSHQSDDGSNATEIASVNGIVTLTDVQLENTGLYTCTAHNGFNGKTFQEAKSVQITIVKTTTTSSTTPSTTPAGQTTASPPVTQGQGDDKGGLGAGAIAGIVVGVVVIIVIVIIAIFCFVKSRNKKDDSIDEPPEKPRNNQNLGFVNRPDIVNNDKNSPFYSQVEKKPYSPDVQYDDVTLDSRPRSRKPVQLYEQNLNNSLYSNDGQQGPYMPTV